MTLQRISIFFFGLLFALGLSYNLLQTEEGSFKSACKTAEANLLNFQNEFEKFTQDNLLLDQIISNKLSEDQVKFLYKKPMQLYLYKNGELVFWNKNNAVLESNPENITGDGSLVKQKNGYYIALKRNYGLYTIVGLQLIKSNYPIVNQYLHNEFAPPYTFDATTKIDYPFAEIGQGIKNKQNRTVYKAVYNNYNSQYAEPIALVVSYVTVVSFWIFVIALLMLVRKQFSLLATFILLIVSCVIFMEVILLFDFEFKKTILFSPELYASQYFGRSLGHLFVNASMLVVIGSFAVYHFYFKKWDFNKVGFGIYTFLTIVYLVLYLSVIESLILDSIISFEINNFTLISLYTLIGLFVIILLTYSLFLHLYVWVYHCYKRYNKYAYLLVFLYFLISAITTYFFDYNSLFFIIPSILFAVSSLYLFLLQDRNHFNRFNYSLLSLIFASLVVSTLLSHYNLINQDDKKASFANQLSENRDLITEYRFEQIQQEIKADPFFKKFFVSPFVSQKELQQRLDYLYFGGYLSKYNINSIAFNLEGKPIKNSTDISLSAYYDLINKNSEDTFSEWLFLIRKKDGKNVYLSILPIENNGVTSGTLVLELSPKTYHKENLYPELLIEQKINPISKYRNKKDYEYAIYKNNYLISQKGEYPFPYFYGVFDFIDEYPMRKNLNGFRLNFFDIDEETKVIISDKKPSFLISISTFSYIFCLMSVLFFLIYGVLHVMNLKTELGPLKAMSFTFKNKINASIIFITVASFIVVGIVTIGYFRELYSINNTDKLIKKQKSVLSSLEYILEKQNDTLNVLPPNMNSEITSLAEIHNIDINLFNLEGNLIISSQPGIFGSGLVSKKINPIAIYQLRQQNKERYIQNEAIGLLQYQSVYVPLRTAKGKTAAILNLPYFAQEETLRQELSNLMVALVNVYVLLLLASIFIAFVISSSITRPLANISKKMGLVSLGTKNEGIEWESDDEIGALVKEYNKMILQIESSASILAQSERESAWREMARQIAHEIKNPLTPMKLGIQHLQRALIEKPEEANELAAKVSKTMIEQIENLAEIATAFSSFAKMPTANKEEVNLIEILQNVMHLFNQNNTTNIFFKQKIDQAIIYADKNQLLSVFNNLIKNAQQATEETDNAKIELFLEESDDYYKIDVVDNGVGIPEDQIHKVFVPNFTTKSSGTGLGLAISKQIIENNKGQISFKSVENKGTTFTVLLPKATK